jgi:hypothetical protein
MRRAIQAGSALFHASYLACRRATSKRSRRSRTGAYRLGQARFDVDAARIDLPDRSIVAALSRRADISACRAARSPRDGRADCRGGGLPARPFLSRFCFHELAERGQPSRKPLLVEMIRPAFVFFGGAIECRPPFNEGLIRLDNGRDADRRNRVAHGERRRITKTICESGRRRNGRAGFAGESCLRLRRGGSLRPDRGPCRLRSPFRFPRRPRRSDRKGVPPPRRLRQTNPIGCYNIISPSPGLSSAASLQSATR